MRTAPPGEVLRQLLARPVILEQPAICDPLGARLAQDAGYEAVSLAGYAIGAHLPLGSQLLLDDIERAVRAVTRACDLPLMLDADAGWGDGQQLTIAIARLETAGVAAIQVDSQHLPAGAPVNLAAERRRSHADLLQRVRTASVARHHALVVARCDVGPGPRYREAVDDAKALLSAGADAILVHGAAADLRRLPRDLPGATLIYTGPLPAVSGQSVFSPGVLEQWGYSAISNKYHRCYCSRAASGTLSTQSATCAARSG